MKIEWHLGLVVKGESEAEWAILKSIHAAYAPPPEPFVQQEDDYGSDELDFVDAPTTHEITNTSD